MSKSLIVLRVLVFSLLLALTGGARAEDPAPVADEWQTVISAQISAFRAHDAAAALSYAAAPFHQTFADPEAFYSMIIAGGYAPIATSRSHSFGKFNVLPDGQVLQEVFILDADQSLYGAIYALGREEAGWRVQGVQMIIAGGYAPIATSRSHSFGKFNVLPDGQVLQEVFILDADQSLYGAIYALGREEAGWRVQGVQMIKQAGMGV